MNKFNAYNRPSNRVIYKKYYGRSKRKTTELKKFFLSAAVIAGLAATTYFGISLYRNYQHQVEMHERKLLKKIDVCVNYRNNNKHKEASHLFIAQENELEKKFMELVMTVAARNNTPNTRQIAIQQLEKFLECKPEINKEVYEKGLDIIMADIQKSENRIKAAKSPLYPLFTIFDLSAPTASERIRNETERINNRKSIVEKLKKIVQKESIE
ncbi:MAG: hypothetical protein N3E37_02565 [Candidatus Micrarchaeota archaeon]|nr:hypothetical protein [Candidatus Micrarchaeota archaeon]